MRERERERVVSRAIPVLELSFWFWLIWFDQSVCVVFLNCFTHFVLVITCWNVTWLTKVVLRICLVTGLLTLLITRCQSWWFVFSRYWISLESIQHSWPTSYRMWNLLTQSIKPLWRGESYGHCHGVWSYVPAVNMITWWVQVNRHLSEACIGYPQCWWAVSQWTPSLGSFRS